MRILLNRICNSEWKILEWDEKPQTNKHSIGFQFYEIIHLPSKENAKMMQVIRLNI